MKCETLIKRYKAAAKQGILLVDMDSMSLAGYYLSNYAGDPIGAVKKDMQEYRVSETIGRATLILIMAVINAKT